MPTEERVHGEVSGTTSRYFSSASENGTSSPGISSRTVDPRDHTSSSGNTVAVTVTVDIDSEIRAQVQGQVAGKEEMADRGGSLRRRVTRNTTVISSNAAQAPIPSKILHGAPMDDGKMNDDGMEIGAAGDVVGKFGSLIEVYRHRSDLNGASQAAPVIVRRSARNLRAPASASSSKSESGELKVSTSPTARKRRVCPEGDGESPPRTPKSSRSARGTPRGASKISVKREEEEKSEQLRHYSEVDGKSEPVTPKKEKANKEKPTPRVTPIKLKLEKPHPEPKNWRRQYELIEKMREKIVAPVDTLGCETPNRERSTDPKTIRFHMLISLMLSSQTKDPVTSAAVTNLHQRLPGGLTAESLAAAEPAIISECIAKVGFWRRKTEYIHEAAKRIVEGGLDDGEPIEPDVEGITPEPGDIPRTLNGLCKLKGVGPKMAFLALQCAWNINAGVGVDVHVHRITKLNLQSWLPPALFKPINHVLVGFGQVVCLPVGPRCDVCFLGKERICPSRVAHVNTKNRKVVEFGFLDADTQEVKAQVEVEVEAGEGEHLTEISMQELAKETGRTLVKAEGSLDF